MKRPTSVPPIELVQISKIASDTRSKASKKEIEKLKEDFESHGQLMAIILTRCEGSNEYVLRAGRKRYEAAQSLDWREIKAVVIPIDADTEDAVISEWVKLIEMQQRLELDHYALAKSAAMMEERHKVKGSEFACQLGLSNGYIYNLMRWYRTIPDKVREAWRQGNPLVNQSELERYSHMKKQDALEAWEMRVRLHASAFEPFSPNKKKKPQQETSAQGPNGALKRKYRRASEREVSKLQAAIDASPLIKPVKDLLTNLNRFHLGISKQVPGITDYTKLPLDIISKEAIKEASEVDIISKEAIKEASEGKEKKGGGEHRAA